MPPMQIGPVRTVPRVCRMARPFPRPADPFPAEHVQAAPAPLPPAAAWWQDRPDLPAGSAQAEAASVRGPFGNAIAWMCRRHGIGPGHPDWPELSRAIVAFGGSLEGSAPASRPRGLQWWENPGIVPGMVPGFGAPARPQRCCNVTLLRMLRRRHRTPCKPKPPQPRMQGCPRHGWPQQRGMFSRVPAPVRRPGRQLPGTANPVMSDARGRSMASPAVLICADENPVSDQVPRMHSMRSADFPPHYE